MVDIDSAIEVLEEVDDRFERGIGTRFGFGELMYEEFNDRLAFWVEKEVLSEGGQGGIGDGG